MKKDLPKMTRMIMMVTKSACSERPDFRSASLSVCWPAKESAFAPVTGDVVNETQVWVYLHGEWRASA